MSSIRLISGRGQSGHEKLTAEIDLPRKGLIWPNLKAVIALYSERFDTTQWKALRLSANFGKPTLARLCEMDACDYLRNDGDSDAEIDRLIAACIERRFNEFKERLNWHQATRLLILEGGKRWESEGFAKCDEIELPEMEKERKRRA